MAEAARWRVAATQSHEAQAFLIRRYIAWRNRHAPDRMLREVVKRAIPAALTALVAGRSP